MPWCYVGKGELAVQHNAAHSAQSIHIRLTVIAVTRYISALCFKFCHSNDQIIILTSVDSRLQSVPDYLVRHYKNIVLARTDFANLVNNTPLAEIFQKSSHTKYFLHNFSDIIRVVLLWQFGGTYFDSDVISQEPVPDQVSPI